MHQNVFLLFFDGLYIFILSLHIYNIYIFIFICTRLYTPRTQMTHIFLQDLTRRLDSIGISTINRLLPILTFTNSTVTVLGGFTPNIFIPGSSKGCQMDGSWGATKQLLRVQTPPLAGCWQVYRYICFTICNININYFN